MILSTIFLAFCKTCTWEILPMLIGAWLLGWLFWWLFNRSKYQNRINGLEQDVKTWKSQVGTMDNQLTSANYELEKAKEDLAQAEMNSRDLHTELKACQESKKGTTPPIIPIPPIPSPPSPEEDDTITDSGVSPDVLQVVSDEPSVAPTTPEPEEDDQPTSVVPAPPPTGYAAMLKADDLKIIEGVGPKIESLLKAGGFKDWKGLAFADIDAVQNILNEAGPRYRVHDPKSWPVQAKFAHEGKWDELVAYQKELSAGRSEKKGKANSSKVEKLYMKARGIKAFSPKDLKIVEGIGPKIEGLLKADGINNWTDLSGADLDRLKSILGAAGERYRLADPTTWPKQAGMAAAGDWETLKAYQDKLKGGKE